MTGNSPAGCCFSRPRTRHRERTVFNTMPAARTGHFGRAMKSKRCASFRFAACVLLVTLWCHCDLTLGDVGIADEEDNLLVQSKDGTIRGTHMQTKKGRLLDAFIGIPFAEPPVGELRFKAPVPYHKWEGILDATEPHGLCPQRNIYTRSDVLEGTEDCLFLNVYRPTKPTTTGPLPVMFFLHGGGWLACAGNNYYYGPEILLDRDVLLVIPNYRLGALGFLSTGDLTVPGNNGLKDQALALKWAKENAEAFGGDPESVTIFGESAGGASVHLHMMSPLTKGLFHRGISQSGTGLCLWACGHEDHGWEHAQKLGNLLNCPVENSKVLVECLRGKDALEIASVDEDFMLWDKDPMIPFRPAVEPPHEGAFLTGFPADLIKQGKVHNVPWMNGINKDDGALRVSALFGIPGLIDELNGNFDYNLAVSLQYHQLADNPSEVSQAIKKYYLKGGPASNSTKQEVIDIYTDGWFHHGVDLATYLHKKHLPNLPVYYYLFAHRGVGSFSEIFGDKVNDYGVCHADELQYLFPVGDGLFPDKIKDEKDLRVTDLMTALWTNFARYGNPTPDADAETPVKWQAVRDAQAMNYFNIGGDSPREMRNEDGLFIERAEFWRALPIRPESYKQRLLTRSAQRKEEL